MFQKFQETPIKHNYVFLDRKTRNMKCYETDPLPYLLNNLSMIFAQPSKFYPVFLTS